VGGADDYMEDIHPTRTIRGSANGARGWLAVASAAVVLALLASACSGDDDGNGATSSPGDGSETATGTPATVTPPLPDPALAEDVLLDFIAAAQDEDIEGAWALYISSIPGDTSQHNASLGCDYFAFASDFPGMKHLFDRIAPLEVTGIFGDAVGSLVVEFTLDGQDSDSYLATLQREPADAPYRLAAFNNGRTSEPNVPDPLPSPEDPRGFCGIWNGSR
jgi:hypothetical protein